MSSDTIVTKANRLIDKCNRNIDIRNQNKMIKVEKLRRIENDLQLEQWMSLRNYLYYKIQDNSLLILLDNREKAISHIASCMRLYLSSSNYYNKLNEIYSVAENYLYWCHLFEGVEVEQA